MDEALELLTGHHDIEEAWELRYFRVYRKGIELDVTVMDEGPASAPNRYMVEVRVADGGEDTPYSIGNADATVKEALFNVHWNNFDGLE